MIDLDAIEARHSVITSGDWRRAEPPMDSGTILAGDRIVSCGSRGYDAGFIAHAPEDVRALIAEVRDLRAQVESRPDISPELAARYLGNRMSITSYVRGIDMEMDQRLREHARKVKL